MKIFGSDNAASDADERELHDLSIDLTGGEAQFLADALEHLSYGTQDKGSFDDGENIIWLYKVEE